MKISLRKANALQQSLNDAIGLINLKTSITVNEYTDPIEQMDIAREKLGDQIQIKLSMLNILYYIRTLVAEANNSSGLTKKLTECAKIDRQLEICNEIVSCKTAEIPEVIRGNLAKMTSITDPRYYNFNEVTTSLFTENDIINSHKDISDLKKQKQKLKDEILNLNIITEIELEKGAVEFLEKEGFL